MSGPKVSNKRLRDTQRVVHLVGGLMLGVYIYIPLIGGPGTHIVQALMQLVVFPAVVATGVLMWQLPRLRRLLKTEQGGKKFEKLPRP